MSNTTKITAKTPLNSMQSVDNVVVTNGGGIDLIPKDKFIPDLAKGIKNQEVNGDTVGALKNAINNVFGGNDTSVAFTFKAMNRFAQNIDNDDASIDTGSQWTLTKVAGHENGKNFVILAVPLFDYGYFLIHRNSSTWSAKKISTTTTL